MAKPKQYQVTVKGKGDRAVAYYLIEAGSEDEAREHIQASEFALWMASRTTDADDAPTGREGQDEPYKVTKIEAA